MAASTVTTRTGKGSWRASIRGAPGWAGATRQATVLGAGGAARAVVAALLDRGIPGILVANRTAERADATRSLDPGRVETTSWPALGGRLAATDLLINTTSLGMAGQPALDIDLAPLPSSAVVTDIVYVPLVTPLLARARDRGLRAVDGLGMLLHQAVAGFEAWFGVRPEVTDDLRARIVADLERTR